MNILKKARDLYWKLSFVLSANQKAYFVVVLIMGGTAAMLEMLGVAAIVPILDVMLDMDLVREKWYVRPFIEPLHLDSDVKIIWLVCIGIITVYIVKNLFFIFYNWVSLKYANKVQRELSVKVLNAYMQQGYIFFVENNTAALLQGISGDISGVYAIIKTFFTLLTKLLTIVCIGAYIFVQSKDMAIVLCGLAVLCLVFLQVVFRKPMSRNGKKARELAQATSKISIEAIQGNKEILAMHKQKFFSKYYESMVAKKNRIMVKVELDTISPAYIIEMICIVGLMSAVVIQMSRIENVYGLITQLSAIAVGAFRILPALGGITSGINTITMYTTQLDRTCQTLKTINELEGEEKAPIKAEYRNIEFRNEIELKNLSFEYPNGEEKVLDNVSLTIKKGQSVALIGPSGAGKTTLADIILGLLKPSTGEVLMDGIDTEELGEEWGRIIGYVPQTMYLIDDTIRRNIAFGELDKDIDDERVWEALRIAQLDDYVRNLKEDINTKIGELGVRFSGGQRQRLAIARALYRNPDILVLDEATAALDNETEAEVMRAIEALQGYKTLIIVAHRLTTVKKCDIIYEIKDKAVVEKNKEEIVWG